MTTTQAEDTRATLALFLAAEVGRAKREYPRVGNAEHPTRWDTRHAALNKMLDEWQAGQS